MSIKVFLVALFGALCWGLAPVFGKLGLRDVHPVDGLAARTVVTLAFVSGWLVASGRLHHLCALSCRDWFFLGLEAFLATLAGDLAYYVALKMGGAGYTAVVLAASPVVTLWFSYLMLHEDFSPLQVFGAAMVVFGVLLMGASTT
ncbi:MAG: EamA family transporter [Clostridia bacterium]|nr:EamA family transporter [Clostridia bacterium]